MLLRMATYLFCSDYYRHNLINENVESNMEVSFESAEGLLVGSIDVALVAENMAVAAEDMGYGIVYLGSLRNDVGRVREILDLPGIPSHYLVWLLVNQQKMKMVLQNLVCH